MHKILPLLTACFCIAIAGCASARSGPEIAAVFDSGVAAYDAGKYDEAFKIWWTLRDEDIAAMRNVAMMLRKGQGTTKDPKKAEEIYEIAADAGLPTAQADLADMLLKGEAGPPDLERALPLLQAAAAANHPIAQYELGQLYETGAPPLVPQNLEVARQLYAAAATHGMKEAGARATFLGPPAVPGAPPVLTAQPLAQAAPASGPAPPP
ncbi:MAG TPA: tetratricopeptide repeat protein [Rhizomicrobium sp.]|jgi:TPR repeat protein